MKVNVITQMYGTSGYASHGRNFANALNKLIDTRITSILPPNWERDCNDEELKMLKVPDDNDRINIIIDLPFNWPQYTVKPKNIGVLVWEGDKIPLSWVDYIKNSKVNQVWVPSSHTYKAIKNTMSEWDQYKHKIKIIPHGVNTKVFKPLGKTNKSVFRFMCNKGFRNKLDRGGIQHALKAFMEEFNKGEAELFLKINPAYTMPPEEIVKIIQDYRIESGKTEDTAPQVIISIDALDTQTLNELYNSCDVFLSPSEAEAFNLPCLEAMACGVPVITTGYGGQTDYVNDSNGWLIDYTLHEVKHEIMYEGIKHATPNIEHLKKLMRESMNDEIILIKGAKALETAKQLTWDNSAQKAIDALTELK